MYVVKYSGPFGFIKPWTAVRDTETYSQNYLTPSIIEGIEKKLFPELLESEEYENRIIRHRLTYSGISPQQEQTQPKGFNITQKKKEGIVEINRPRSILKRGILINPVLLLGFVKLEYALTAIEQHICLCRNEDILMPALFQSEEYIIEADETEFDKPDIGFNGFELIVDKQGKSEQSFIVGFNRYHNSHPMHGSIHIVGSNPLISTE